MKQIDEGILKMSLMYKQGGKVFFMDKEITREAIECASVDVVGHAARIGWNEIKKIMEEVGE